MDWEAVNSIGKGKGHTLEKDTKFTSLNTSTKVSSADTELETPQWHETLKS